MNLAVGAPLLLDILFDDLFVPILTHGICVESACPELSAPEHLFDLRMGTENLFCGDTLDDLCYCGGGHCGNTLNEEMDMIFIGPNLDEMDLVTFCYPHAHLFEGTLHRFRENLSPILGRAYHVVEKKCLVVPFDDVLAHPFILPHVVADGDVHGKGVRAAELRGIFRLKVIDRPVLFVNGLLLFVASFVPFATAFAGEAHWNAPLPVAIYGLVMLAVSLAFCRLRVAASRCTEDLALKSRQLREAHTSRYFAVAVFVAICCTAFAPRLALSLYAIVSLIGVVQRCHQAAGKTGRDVRRK
jgi:hypothetical protein